MKALRKQRQLGWMHHSHSSPTRDHPEVQSMSPDTISKPIGFNLLYLETERSPDNLLPDNLLTDHFLNNLAPK